MIQADPSIDIVTEIPSSRPKWFPQAAAPLIDDENLKKLYPSFLELKQVIVIHRHGIFPLGFSTECLINVYSNLF